MGAEQFRTYGHGLCADDAFKMCHERATYLWGHGGYTGTIAEKSGCIVIDLPKGTHLKKIVAALEGTWEEGDKGWRYLTERLPEHTVRKMVNTYNDKWGPAVALKVTGDLNDTYRKRFKVPRGQQVYVLLGWASS